MASVFAHLAVGATSARLAGESKKIRVSPKLYIILMLSSAMPDLDIITFDFGIPYSHWLGHRGLTHSLFFAAIWAALMVLIFFRKELSSGFSALRYFLVFLIVTASHGVIDAMTNGGRGIGFFIPFSNERIFLPFRPIQVSPLGIENFFTEWGWRVIMSEVYWIFIPCALLWVVTEVAGKVKFHS